MKYFEVAVNKITRYNIQANYHQKKNLQKNLVSGRIYSKGSDRSKSIRMEGRNGTENQRVDSCEKAYYVQLVQYHSP